MYPIITKVTGKQIDLSSIISEETSMQASSYTDMGNNLISAANDEVEVTYIEKIKDDIKTNVENKGYVVNDVSVDVETNDKNNYGKINTINLKIGVGAGAGGSPNSSINTNNTINTIQPIEKVNINDKNGVGASPRDARTKYNSRNTN